MSIKDVKDCAEYADVVNIIPQVVPVPSNDNLKQQTLVEELVVYTEEMALFHRHEITSPRYSFNVPTQDHPVKDELLPENYETDDVFEDKPLYTHHIEGHIFIENTNVKMEPSKSGVYMSTGLLATCDVSSIPAAPWGCSEEPQNFNPVVSGKDMFAIPKLSDLFDDEEDVGLVMKEDRGTTAVDDTDRWGYSHTTYDPGYGIPLRMMDYYDSVDNIPVQDMGKEGQDEVDNHEVKANSLDQLVKHGDNDGKMISFLDSGQIETTSTGGDQIVRSTDAGDNNQDIFHDSTTGYGSYQVNYHLNDVDQSAENNDSVFVNVDTMLVNQTAGVKQRKLSSYDNTITPDDRVLIESDNIQYLGENITMKEILKKEVEESQPEEQTKEVLPLCFKKPSEGNASNNALTPEHQITTTSSENTSPALRECTTGVRVTSRDSLAGVGPDWEESPSSSDDAGDQLEKLAISSISLAFGQTPVIKESEGVVKTNVSLVSKLKKELREGLILPSLQPPAIKGNERYEKEDGRQIIGEEEMEYESKQKDPIKIQEQQQNGEEQNTGLVESEDQHEEGTIKPFEQTNKEREKQRETEGAMKSKQEMLHNVDSSVTCLTIGKTNELIVESEPDNLMNENVLDKDSGEEINESNKLLILEQKERNDEESADKTWPDHVENGVINKNSNDNDDQVFEEDSQVCESDINGQTKKLNEVCELVEEINDIVHGNEGNMINDDVQLRTSKVKKGETCDVHEETLDVPNIVVTDDISGKNEGILRKDDISQNIDTTGSKDCLIKKTKDTGSDVQLEDQEGFDNLKSDNKLKSISKDESSLTATKSEKLYSDSTSENIEKFNEEMTTNDTRTSFEQDNGYTVKRRASFSDIVVVRDNDTEGQEDMHRWGDLNQPKPPPEGSSKGVVNARYV